METGVCRCMRMMGMKKLRSKRPPRPTPSRKQCTILSRRIWTEVTLSLGVSGDKIISKGGKSIC
jgi:hypothetical protein